MATIPYENGKKMSDLTVLTEAADDAKLFIHDGTGMKCISAGNLKKDIKALVNAAQSTINAIATTGAGAHNSIYVVRTLVLPSPPLSMRLSRLALSMTCTSVTTGSSAA